MPKDHHHHKKHHHKHHHKKHHHKHEHKWDSDDEEEHKPGHKHHKPDHKHHDKKHHHHDKKHHKKHHHKHHDKKHHHAKKHHHKHHHSGSESEGSWESKSHGSWSEEEEYEAPPAPAEPKIDDQAIDDSEPEEVEEEAADDDDDGKNKLSYQQRLDAKKKKKKKFGKKPTAGATAATASAMGAAAVPAEEEDGGGLSTFGKIGIGLGAGALALGAGAAAHHMKKKSDKKEDEKTAADADANAAALRPDWTTVEEVNSGSIDLYPGLIYEADHSTPMADHDVDNHVIEIKEACKGWGTDEERLIKALADESPELRTKIFYRFADMYDKDLEQLIKKECKGDFGTAMRLLTLPPDMLDAKLLQMATRFGGTREYHLYPIICGRSNKDIEILKKTYFKLFDKDMGSVIESEVHGTLERLLLASIQGVEETFDSSVHTAEKAKADAVAFYEAGQGGWGTDEKSLFKLLCSAPPQHLKAVNEIYADSYGYTLFRAFEKELKGVTEKAVTFALGMKLKPYEFVARLIESACAGMGTDELLLTSIVIRYQNIMKEVMPVYQELYGRTIQDRVKGEAKGLHEVVLLEVLNSV